MEKKMDDIKFEVTLDEAKKIFEALGKLPFAEVYELIGKLNDQVNQSKEESNGHNNIMQGN